MRILVAHNVSRARTGGMSRLMGSIHDRVVDAGHAVEYLSAEDVPVWACGRWGRIAFPILIRRVVRDAARRGEPYDIVNVHEPSAVGIVVARQSLGSPAVVVTSHGVESRAWQVQLDERKAGRGGPSLRTRIVYPPTSLWQSNVGFHYSDHIFCTNGDDQAYLMSRFRLPSRHFTKVCAAADPIYALAAGRRNYGRASQLLFAGTWIPRKGISEIVSAFTILAERHPEIRLTVLSGGIAEDTILKAFRRDLRGRVSCRRTKNDQDNARVFAESDIYVLPTLFDGGPLTSVEAMMSGLPVVTTPIGLMKEALRDGKNGMLVPIRSTDAVVKAVERLLGDPELRATIGRAAQRDALSEYTWDKVAKPVTEAYLRLAVDQRENNGRGLLPNTYDSRNLAIH